uniref:DUF1534 domain-containing protein n=1 Tax=Mesocestoides corti TaxID=53468 RepID=A0A5K3F913_MESCO
MLITSEIRGRSDWKVNQRRHSSSRDGVGFFMLSTGTKWSLVARREAVCVSRCKTPTAVRTRVPRQQRRRRHPRESYAECARLAKSHTVASN